MAEPDLRLGAAVAKPSKAKKKRNTYTIAHEQWLCAFKAANPAVTHTELIREFNTNFGNEWSPNG